MNSVFSFENGMPQGITAINSTISINNVHSRDGQSSLEWRFQEGSSLVFDAPIPFDFLNMASISKAIDTFVMWVHCPVISDGKLLVEFVKNNYVCCSFEMILGYTGWRTAWVAYERDMQGVPQNNMDSFRITANTDGEGVLQLDQIITLAKVDSRNHTPDYHLPDVHDSINTEANNHWLSLLKYMRQQTNGIANAQKVADVSELTTITNRLEEFILKNTSDADETAIMQEISALGLEAGTKRRIDIMHIRECYPKSKYDELTALTDALEFRQVGKLLLGLACLWHKGNENQKAIAQTEYVRLIKHLFYLGYQCGSALGTTHHSGYQTREFMYSMFLMRQVLLDEGICQAAADLASWYSGTGRILGSDEEIKLESLDTFNTLSHGMLIGILLQEESARVHYLLKGAQHWLNACLLPAPGLKGPFKTDNCMFHHCNHYPAYAIGGIENIASFIYFISVPSYKISEKAHVSVKNAVLAFRIYCNTLEWSVGMSARHPDGSNTMYSGMSSLASFRYLALSGSPDGSQEIDSDLAAACMRLYPYINEKDNTFFNTPAEKTPSGHWNFNYGCSSVHRRDEWMLTVRGFSKYIWGNETYVAANLYGRYIAYGHLELLNRGAPINHDESGYNQFGFDWNFFPGTTAIALPFNLLRSDVRNVDTYSGFEEMLISDNAFCGGTRLLNNGVFALNLHEHAKYNGTHRAKKSYFFIDGYVVCLGSNIENISEHPTYTTIYQKAVKAGESVDISKQEPIITDNKQNRYYIPSNQNIKIESQEQTTPNHENDEPCKGTFARALICHGISPKNAEYEYAVLADDNINADAFANSTPYTVLQKDNALHQLEADNTIYSVFFEAGNSKNGNVQSVDTPCLVIEKEDTQGMHLALCDPDMRFYEGVEADQLEDDGTQREVSLYSRTWQANHSAPHKLSMTIKGIWAHPKNMNKGTEVSYNNGDTILQQICCEAKTYTYYMVKG